MGQGEAGRFRTRDKGGKVKAWVGIDGKSSGGEAGLARKKI